MSEPVLCVGSNMTSLGAAVAARIGVRASSLAVERFPDGELRVALTESVHARDVFVLQSLSSPIGEAALELLLVADAAWRSGADRVCAVLPYFGYARQDRRRAEGEPLGAKVMARLVDAGAFTRVVVLDLHAPAIASAFAGPVDHVTAVPLLVDALRSTVPRDAVIVSPDLGAVKLAERYASGLSAPIAIVHKQRVSPTSVAVHEIVGDVEGRTPVIVDDMISTGATLVAAVAALRSRGCVARPIIAATHALLVGPARARLAALDPARVLVTDSVTGSSVTDNVSRDESAVAIAPGSELRLERVSLAPLLADAIRCLHLGEPLGDRLSQV